MLATFKLIALGSPSLETVSYSLVTEFSLERAVVCDSSGLLSKFGAKYWFFEVSLSCGDY